MKYYINYNTDGRILGFVKQDTNINIEVANAQWVEAQKYNKIIINGPDITFDRVDWRTQTEIEAQRVSAIKAEAGRIILERYPEFKQRNAHLGIYNQVFIDEMKAFIADVIAQSDALELDSTKSKDDFVV